jgi:hypothetical protein
MSILPNNTDICPHCNDVNVDYDETCSECGEPVSISLKSLSELADKLNIPYSFVKHGRINTLTYVIQEDPYPGQWGNNNIEVQYRMEGEIHHVNITGTFQ